jgi:DNA-binding transcriptional MerR regulator
MKRYIKSLISTEQLVRFAKEQHLDLGRGNLRRTINFYISKGLLPRRIRTHEGKLNWGFPTYAKALLVRISGLKKEGLALADIRNHIEDEVKKGYEQFKKPDYSLSGVEDEFSDPVYDYNYTFIQSEIREALKHLRSGNNQELETILSNLHAILTPPAEGERHLIIVDINKRPKLLKIPAPTTAGKRSSSSPRGRPRKRKS